MDDAHVVPPKWLNIAAFFIGSISLFVNPIYQLSQGEDAGDAFWNHALRSLDWTFFLRQFPPMLLFFGIVALIAGVWLRRSFEENKWWPWVRVGASLLLGMSVSMVIIHQLMDVAYFRGAFILVAAAYAIAILFFLVLLCEKPIPLVQRKEEKIDLLGSARNTFNLITVFICIWLLIPATPAILDVAPSPPSAPKEGYGSSPSPYSVTTQSFAYPMPDNVSAIIGDFEGDIEFSIFLTLPIIPEESGMTTIPLAIMLHGFGNPYWETYVDWGTQLSAKGMAVAFIQYPSDVHPEGVETFDLIEAQGMSNHPQHFPRSAAIASAISHLDSIALTENRSDWIETTLGDIIIDPSHLWVGGHSLGAGLSFRSLDESMQRGWGSQSLFIALEAPYAHSVDSELRGDISKLPIHTMGHIAISEDDTSVNPCYGVWHQKRIVSRSSEPNLVSGQVLLLTIHSDRHGFPPMVASHFIQTSQVHEELADWGFYRRADAQADYMVAQSSGDMITIASAGSYLQDPSSLSGMGEWSDGVPVNEITVFTDAMNDGTQEYRDCSKEIEAWN